MPGASEINPFLARFLPLLNPLALLPSDLWGRQAEDFTYSVNFLPATGSVTTQGTVQINNDSDFVLCGMRATPAADPGEVVFTTCPALTIQISDSGSGRSFFDQPAALPNVCGIAVTNADFGQGARYFPKLIAGGSTLTVAITNLTATAVRLRLSFRGFKLFPFAKG